MAYLACAVQEFRPLKIIGQYMEVLKVYYLGIHAVCHLFIFQPELWFLQIYRIWVISQIPVNLSALLNLIVKTVY